MKLINEFLKFMELSNKNETTIINYRIDLVYYHNYFKNLKNIDDEVELYKSLTVKNMDALVADLKKEYSSNSIYRKISAIKHFHKWMIREGLLTDDVSRFLIRPVKDELLPIFLTRSEAEALLEGLDYSSKKTQVRDKAIITTLLFLGLREHELINIKIKDIDFNNNTVTVMGKRGMQRVLPLGDNGILIKCFEDVMDWNETLTTFKDKDYLFVSERTGSKLTGKTIDRIVEYACVCADIKKVTPHALRHTAATLMVDGGASIYDVQQTLGHKKIDTTEIYAHTSTRRVAAAINCNPVMKSKKKAKVTKLYNYSSQVNRSSGLTSNA